jgi:hypothetical protein
MKTTQSNQLPLLTIDVLRNGYGRRYTGLPVDTISAEQVTIDCSNGYLHPEHFDLQPGDVVRWKSGGHYFEASIASVERQDKAVQVALQTAHELPDDFFPY